MKLIVVLAFHLTLGDQASRDSRDVEPDGSLRVAGTSFPFLVGEIGNTQTEESLKKKIHYWTYGSRSHLKFIVIFRIMKKEPTGYCVLVSVDKLEKERRPTPENPQSYITRATHVIADEEIYPKISAKTFDIALTDVLPGGLTMILPLSPSVCVRLEPRAGERSKPMKQYRTMLGTLARAILMKCRCQLLPFLITEGSPAVPLRATTTNPTIRVGRARELIEMTIEVSGRDHREIERHERRHER